MSNSELKIVFIGTVLFSYTMLEKLTSLNANITGVCTKKTSNFNNDFCDLSSLCISNNIPYKYVTDINDSETINWIKSCKPDVIFCFGWSNLLKKELLNLSKIGVIGYHPTKLPLNRGRHPLIWALALGLENSASTFFFMDEGADTGDILSQKEFKITYKDDAKSLYAKVSNIALSQIEKFLPELQANSFKRIKQKNSLPNYWRKRNKNDGLIHFGMNSQTIYNLVRALTRPYIGAHIFYKNQDIKIWKVKELNNIDVNIEYGKILKVKNNTIIVKTADGAIEILEHNFNELPKEGEYL
jgi:methionyl-tRNA formyltransferase